MVLEFAVVQNGNNATTTSGMQILPDVDDEDLEKQGDSIPNHEDPIEYKYDPENMYQVSVPSESWGSIAIADIYPQFGRVEGGTPINLLAKLPMLEDRLNPLSQLHCNFGNLYHTPVEVIVPNLANGTRL